MIGNVSAAAGAVNRHVAGGEQMRLFSTPADGENMGVLDQENHIRQSLPPFCLYEALLE